MLAEFGLELADDVEIRVLGLSADLRYIVLPMRPEGTDGMERGRARRARHARLR